MSLFMYATHGHLHVAALSSRSRNIREAMDTELARPLGLLDGQDRLGRH